MACCITLTTYSDYETDDTPARRVTISRLTDALVVALRADGLTVTGSLTGHAIDLRYSASSTV